MVTVLFMVPVASLMLVLVMHLAVRVALRRTVPGGFAPPVSIIKPVRGVDDGLLENLESFARIDYPEWEILIGTEDPADAALPLVREFARRHPELSISVHITPEPFGMNPKVKVLAPLTAKARHGFVLVSDSNVRVEPGFLRKSVAPFADPKVALVSNPVIGRGERTLGSQLENAHLNSFVLGAICGANLFGKACVLGKSMMIRRDAFEATCGWGNLKNVLAEDYFSGWRLETKGYRVAVAPTTVTNWNETTTPSRFLARHVRWSQLRRRIDPFMYTLELLLNPIPLAIPLALSGGTRALAVAMLVALVKIASDRSIATRLRPGDAPPGIATILLKDVVLLPWIWGVGAVKRTVDWRGHPVRLGRNTRLLTARESRMAATREAA